MIKINLLGQDTGTDYSKHLVLGGFVASIVLTLLVCAWMQMSISSDIEDLEQRKTTLESDLKRLQAVTQEVKDIEKKQKDLEERLIRIAILKRNKRGPAKVMDALNLAVPDKAWLTEVKEKNGVFAIAGFAIDGETVSTFMRELERSEHFPKIDLNFSRQAVRQGVKIQEFSIKATVSYGGRIAPVAEENKVQEQEKASTKG